MPMQKGPLSIFVLYMIKYIYTFIFLVLFIYAKKKESSFLTLEKYAYTMQIIQVSLCQSHRY